MTTDNTTAPTDDQLHQFRYAPGNYWCKCHDCQEMFTGDKRANTCRPCAVKLFHQMEAATCKESLHVQEGKAAPEEIYLTVINGGEELHPIWISKKTEKNQVRYIRADLSEEWKHKAELYDERKKAECKSLAVQSIPERLNDDT